MTAMNDELLKQISRAAKLTENIRLTNSKDLDDWRDDVSYVEALLKDILAKALATGTAQATECETNETEGLRAELDELRHDVTRNYDISCELAADLVSAEAELDAAKRALAEKGVQKVPCDKCAGEGRLFSDILQQGVPCDVCNGLGIRDRRAALAAKSTKED